MNTLFRYFYYISIQLLKTPGYILRNSKVSFSTKVKLSTTVIKSKIGKYCYIGGETYLVNTIVGNYCSIASGVKAGGMEHSWWWASTSPHLSNCNVSDKLTIIEDDVWIGVNSIIRQGVKIGRGAVIGAGSVVLKDIPPFTISAGIPARHIRVRFSNEIMSQISQTEYWNCKPSEAKERLKEISLPKFYEDKS